MSHAVRDNRQELNPRHFAGLIFLPLHCRGKNYERGDEFGAVISTVTDLGFTSDDFLMRTTFFFFFNFQAVYGNPEWTHLENGTTLSHILEDESWVFQQILRWFGNRSRLPSAAKKECFCVFNIVGGKGFTQH